MKAVIRARGEITATLVKLVIRAKATNPLVNGDVRLVIHAKVVIHANRHVSGHVRMHVNRVVKPAIAAKANVRYLVSTAVRCPARIVAK